MFRPVKDAITGDADRRTHAGFGHESGGMKSVEWYTPPEVFEALGLQFDLDPCSPGAGKTFVPARKHYTEAEDGLASPWHGCVFVNPPYSKHTAAWMRKFAQHRNGVALVFSRTGARWFQEFLADADVICFISGRVRFFRGNTTDRAGDNPGADSMLVGYGEKATRAILNSGLGVCVHPVLHLAA